MEKIKSNKLSEEEKWKNLIKKAALARNDHFTGREVTIISIKEDQIRFVFKGQKLAAFTASKTYLEGFEDND